MSLRSGPRCITESKKRCALIVLASVACGALFLWQEVLSDQNVIVIYFNRPSDVIGCFRTTPGQLLLGSLINICTSIVSLFLAGSLAMMLLRLGLRAEGRLSLIERLAVWSQIVPVLVIVTIFLLLEMEICKSLNITQPQTKLGEVPWIILNCVGPVTLSLLFPPIVWGADDILNTAVQMKSLLRIWQAPVNWRIRHIYQPAGLHGVLAGVRISATWAVVASLITEGLLSGVPGQGMTLGQRLMRPFSSSPQKGQTVAVILVSVILGFGVYSVAYLIERRVNRLVYGNQVVTDREYPLLAT